MKSRNPMNRPALAYVMLLAILSVPQVHAESGIGEGKATAIEVCKPTGERAYLSRLICPTGESPLYKRIGSFGSRHQRPESLSTEEAMAVLERMNRYEALKPGEPDYHVIDGYEIVCGETKRIVFFDMYHCDQPSPTQAIAGFEIRAEQTVSEFNTPATFNSNLTSLLERLSAHATREQYNQIEGAVKSSPALLSQMNKLASSGQLTEIIVASQDPVSGKEGHEAYIDNTRAIFSAGLLNGLLLNRHPNHVAKADDIYPNHSVFALGHLAFHAATAEEMKLVEAEFERKVKEQSKTPGRNDYTDVFKFYLNRKIENEASAFIQSWNYVVDAAIQSNGKRLLSSSQFLALFTNLRYLGYFDKALRLPENSLQFSKTGTIEMTKRNIDAMVSSLRTSALADIK